MTGFIFWNLAASKNAYQEVSSKERVVESTIALASFLQDHNLTTSKVIDTSQPVPDDFELHSDDLTADGLKFIRDGLDRWLRSIDDNRKPVTTKSLERTYKKLFNTG